MKTSLLSLALSFLAVAAGIVPTARAAAPQVDLSDDAIREVLRYLYRWHFDESLFWAEGTPEKLEIWLRPLERDRDAGDASRFAEMLVPAVQLNVHLKQADYELAELGVQVRNAGYRITAVEPYRQPPAPRGRYEVRTFVFQEVVAQLFATRNEHRYPDERVRAHLGTALKQRVITELTAAGEEAVVPPDPQVFWVAPLSPVSNDLWVIWENEHKLIKFTSDADYDSDAFWVVQPLGITVFDFTEDVVVSLAEVPGSDAYITRGWAGRALFNCTVLGQRLVFTPDDIREL
jgi:hypothetical protein